MQAPVSVSNNAILCQQKRSRQMKRSLEADEKRSLDADKKRSLEADEEISEGR
jgi:hypothetical protein